MSSSESVLVIEKKKKYKPGQGPSNKPKSQADIIAEKAAAKKQKEEEEFKAAEVKRQAEIEHAAELERMRRASAKHEAHKLSDAEKEAAAVRMREASRLAFHVGVNKAKSRDKFDNQVAQEVGND
jgi:hypothetical protein